jgi:murein DD-endopeptidase MepM/ murein hydrolase activator NlpD
MRRWVVAFAFLIAAGLAWEFRAELMRRLPPWLFGGTPHQQFARELRRQDLDRTPAGIAWFTSADAALTDAPPAPPVFSRDGTFSTDGVLSWRLTARRGQRIVVDVTTDETPLFIDLFDASDLAPLAHAEAATHRVEFEPREDQDIVVRVQGGLSPRDTYTVTQHAEATFAFPVQGMTPRAIGGLWGDGRDAGRRRHEGIDIFAPRGTPVLAATDGIVSTQTTNRLGGNVVWIWSLNERAALYYAHLDRQAVTPGEHVSAGDVIGYVGTTGNARGTSPHLHFGIYAAPGAVDPLPFVCDAPCGERLMQQPPRHVGEIDDDA